MKFLPQTSIFSPVRSRSDRLLEWKKARRAERYRVFIQAQGVIEPERILTLPGNTLSLNEFPSGSVLTLSVSAVDATGESRRSEPLTVALQ